ncbi:MAG: hypothetical protein HYY13_03905 [Nitrospirae bacterium]|nr:hypothetical protein [Nitrospirota bacterium]
MAIAVEIYEALRSAGADEAKAKSAAEKFDQALEAKFQHELKALATRDELEKGLSNLRAELIKWMFIFWIGQFASIVGVLTAILFAFFKP